MACSGNDVQREQTKLDSPIVKEELVLKREETQQEEIKTEKKDNVGIVQELFPKIIEVYHHDPKAFTQGLIYRNGFLYESTGQYGSSELRKVDIKSGEVLQSTPISRRFFGEGIEELNGVIYMLTWQSGVALTFDFNSLSQKNDYSYYGEGWGLCSDGNKLFMSDGSNIIRPYSTEFKPLGNISVSYDGEPVYYLNELEFVDGYIWANVWQNDVILKIDISTGNVVAFADLSNLRKELSPNNRQAETLNGIAYNPTENLFYVTGKLWDKMFAIKFE